MKRLTLCLVLAILLLAPTSIAFAAAQGRDCNETHVPPPSVICENKTTTFYYAYWRCEDCEYSSTCLNDDDCLYIWKLEYSDTACQKLISEYRGTRRGCED
jgi:hypothetical protein